MANICRKIGVNIYSFMQSKNITPDDLAKELDCPLKDIWNVIEGKVMIPPYEVERIAGVLGTTKENLVKYDSDRLAPNLAFMNEFSNPENLDRILDLMDEYVEIQEAI